MSFDVHIAAHRQFNKIMLEAESAFGENMKIETKHVDNGYINSTNRYWPVRIEDYDLKAEWMLDTVAGLRAKAPTDRKGAVDFLSKQEDAFLKVQRAERLVLQPFKELMGALRSGEIEAYGRQPGTSEREPIPSTEWELASTRIDFQSGSLHICAHASAIRAGDDPNADLVWTEILHPLWLEVSLHWPVEVEIEELPAPERARSGPKQKVLWEEGYQRLVLELCDQGLPSSGRALSEMMRGCFSKMRDENNRKAIVPSVTSVDRELRDNWKIVWRAAQANGKRLKPK